LICIQKISYLTAQISSAQSTASFEKIVSTTKRKHKGSYPGVISTDPKVDQCFFTKETNTGRSIIKPVRKIIIIVESNKTALNVFPIFQLLPINACDNCRVQKIKYNRRTPYNNYLQNESRDCNYPKKPRLKRKPLKKTETFFDLSTSFSQPSSPPI